MEHVQLHCQIWIGRLNGRVVSPPIFSRTEREQTTHSMLVYESWREEDHGNHEMPRSEDLSPSSRSQHRLAVA